MNYQGRCHCGAIRFEVDADDHVEVEDCNCSICTATGHLHLIVRGDRFRLLTDSSRLTEYRFNTGTARHFFCSTCGIKSFYVPRSHPDGYSVNGRCLAPETIASRTILPFDGENWEAHVEELPALPEDA